MVVRCKNRNLIGHILLCEEVGGEYQGKLWWIVSPPLLKRLGIMDNCLKPLRNPGEWEVDETLTGKKEPVFVEVRIGGKP